jgi:hypothetical protein
MVHTETIHDHDRINAHPSETIHDHDRVNVHLP